MSELTTPIRIDIPGVGSIESADLYLKSEVDRVIAEKDAKIIQLEALIENYDRISREIIDNANHQKYKRCLDKAEQCEVTARFYGNAVPKVLNKDITDPDRQKVFRRLKHYKKWYLRWLKIAEIFKEAK